ncbi:type II toxin-antitoxin system PemK/MazF family toxin [Thiomicrospira microaerophila]|uniref:type II toxin-antitoxin system PemK/MazF family toxin n=1 Tax=Thiomicrospira microaerophila TaxID=406020 RepID=UPI00200C131B|nr:type II toxin-antitoxin system PemK/MazF family toxin [Thiomicrospira microaerophila]UQB42510.1 type II toxin-antitoxin system PemK/MazF family toxin [Thiomicrospira microaerophila]
MEIVCGEIVLCEFIFSDGLGVKSSPVLVFKDNLPFEDFVGIPVSAQPVRHQDEVLLSNVDFELGGLPKDSKLIIRKTFVINKHVIKKSYGVLNKTRYTAIKNSFCDYFDCR